MNVALRNVGIVCALALSLGTLSAVVPEKYKTIVDRNPFGLVPPPEPVATNAVAPPVDIKVTGFATIGGETFVYLAVPEKDKKDQFKYLSLRAGQQEGAIQVVEISRSAGEVNVNNAGVTMSLSLDKHGFQSGKGPAPMPVMQTAAVAAQPTSPVYVPPSSPAPVVPAYIPNQTGTPSTYQANVPATPQNGLGQGGGYSGVVYRGSQDSRSGSSIATQPTYTGATFNNNNSGSHNLGGNTGQNPGDNGGDGRKRDDGSPTVPSDPPAIPSDPPPQPPVVHGWRGMQPPLPFN